MKNSLILMILATALFSSDLVLKKGQSRSFSMSSNIQTVFVSDPKVVDYKIVNNKELVIFSSELGTSSIKVWSKSGVVLDIEILVDDVAADLSRITKLLMQKNPNSQILIDKLGEESYILSGFAPDEESKERIYKMAVAALGLSINKNDAAASAPQAQSTTGGGAAQNNAQNQLEFLEKIKSDNLINEIKVYGKKQVNVKLVVADVEKTLLEKLGVDWNSGGVFSPPRLSIGKNIPLIAKNSSLTLNAVVNAIENDDVAKILAQPNLSVLSGEEASFTVQSEYTPFTNTVGISGETISSPGTPREYGISLTIKPKVSSSKKISLAITQEVSNIQSIVEVGKASAANMKTRRTQSVIELASGDSFVLGGLLDERQNESISSVPILGKIPFIGMFFRKTNITKTKSELIVIATVTLTEPISADELKRPNFKVRSALGALVNLPKSTSTDVLRFVNSSGFIVERRGH